MLINVKFSFDENTYRHYLNDILSVLHCHHYLCLTTKMAIDFKEIGGIDILKSSIRDSIYAVLISYYNKNKISSIEEKLQIGAEYFSIMGLGRMVMKVNKNNTKVKLTHSHVDQGWIKKWGNHNEPINYFTCGYIEGIFSAAFEKPLDAFSVTETESIVKGEAQSVFKVH